MGQSACRVSGWSYIILICFIFLSSGMAIGDIAPKPEGQDGQRPVSDTPVPDTPVLDTPVLDTPVSDTPVSDTPVPDTPVPDTPVLDTPVPDTPTDTNRSTLTKTSPALKTEFSLTTGMRNDDIQWSIAGNGINVLSDLSWTDVDSYQISLENRTLIKKNIYFRGQINYALVVDGKVRDSDFGRNNSMDEWSRSISESDGDHLYDISAGGGYPFYFFERKLALTPMLGISYHKQNLRIRNGTQVVSVTNPFDGSMPPAVGPLSSKLDSSYYARWVGPWIGCDVTYKPKMREPVHHDMELRLSMALHWADYHGEGNWNLRSDLAHPKSFEHEADGFGITISGQCLVNLTAQWHLAFNISHQDWSTGTGTDRKFLASGGSVSTRLNEVNWNSTSFTMGAAYQF